MNRPHLPNSTPHDPGSTPSTRVENSARAESFEQQVRTFLLDRGCTGLGVKVRASTVVVDLFYVRLENRISQTAVEITGEDMDRVMSQIPLKTTTPDVMEAAHLCESAVCA